MLGHSKDVSGQFNLQVSAVTGERGDQTLFEGLNFELPAGTGLRIAGPNGSGKTTLLRMLAGLSRPTQGTVSLSRNPESNTQALSLSEHRERVMYMGHNPGLNLRLNAVENLSFWLELQRRGEPKGGDNKLEREEACREALQMAGLYEQQLLACSELSAGQKRRASIARLFLQERYIANKCLWILDEPLTSLDKEFSEVLQTRVAKHIAGGGLLVLTTHQTPEGIALQELQLNDFS